MDGHGVFKANTPSTLFPTNSCSDCEHANGIEQRAIRTFPVTASKMAGSIPKNGTVADPGLVSIAPGKGVTTIEPVSVCLK